VGGVRAAGFLAARAREMRLFSVKIVLIDPMVIRAFGLIVFMPHVWALSFSHFFHVSFYVISLYS